MPRLIDTGMGFRAVVALACWTTAVCCGQLVQAETDEGAENLRDKVKQVSRGSSTRAARTAAVAALNLGNLAPEHRQRAQQILGEVSLYRQLPTYRFEVHPEAYSFFTAYPDVAVSIWRAMKISKCEMWQTGPKTYEAEAGDGTLGTIEVVLRTPNQAIIISEGVFKSPLLATPIAARALIHLRSQFQQDEQGLVWVTHTADLFVAFPSQTVETAAKLVSPVSNYIADRNFQEVSVFVAMMSMAMSRQPGWVEHLAKGLEGVLDVRRSQLLKVTARVYVSTRRRELQDSPLVDSVKLEDVMEPLRLEAAQTPLEDDASPVVPLRAPSGGNTSGGNTSGVPAKRVSSASSSSAVR